MEMKFMDNVLYNESQISLALDVYVNEALDEYDGAFKKLVEL